MTAERAREVRWVAVADEAGDLAHRQRRIGLEQSRRGSHPRIEKLAAKAGAGASVRPLQRPGRDSKRVGDVTQRERLGVARGDETPGGEAQGRVLGRGSGAHES